MTVIVSAATNLDSDTGSYVERAGRAALDCLAAAEVAPDEVGLLINVGVHRDSNIVEPAVAALLQQRIGFGLEYTKPRHPFSFDLGNGACGLLYAVAVAESFLATGDLAYVLITAGESHPSKRNNADFPFTAAGGALLLGRAEGGFGSLHAASDSGPLAPSSYVPLTEVGATGRDSMRVTEPPDPLDHAVATVRRCADAEQLNLGDAVVLAPSPTPDFGDRLARKLDLERSAVVTADVGDTHSAAPLFAYSAAADVLAGRPTTPVLWLAAGGPSAACMAYRRST